MLLQVRVAFSLGLIILFCSCLSTIAQSQEQQLRIDVQTRHFGPDQGLPSSELYSLLQDSLGYLWIASDNGLSRFDGKRFKHFSAENGLGDNVVLQLAEHHSGRILMATLNNGLYEYQEDSIYPFSSEIIFRNQIKAEEIPNDLLALPDGTVGLGVNCSGVISLGPDGKLKRGYQNEGKGIWIREQNGELLIGNWWAAEESGTGLKIVVEREAVVEEFTVSHDPLSTGPSRAVMHRDHLLISNGSKLYLINPQGKFERLVLPDVVNCMISSELYGILIGTAQRGILRFNTVNDLLEGKYQNWLGNSAVSDLLEIDGGGLWCSTLNEGLIFISDPSIRIITSGAGIDAITTRNLEVLALQSMDGSIFSIDSNSKTVRRREIQAPAGSVGIYYDDKYNGIYTYSREGRYWNGDRWNYLYDENGEELTGVLALFPGRGDHLWAAGRHGFMLIDRKTRRWEIPAGSEELNLRIICVLEEEDGSLWVSTSNGLFSGMPGHLEPVKEIGGIPIRGRVEDLLEIASNTIAFGIKGQGLLLYQRDSEKSKLYGTTDGLTSTLIEDLAYSGNGELYLATSAGVQRLILNELEIIDIQNINQSDGLLTNEANKLLLCGNTLFVLSPNGISAVRSWPIHQIAPRLLINSITGNEKKYPLEESFSLIYPESSLRVVFTGFQYYHPEELKFRYRIVNEDSTWRETRSNVLNMSDLSSGEYHLQIQAGIEKAWSLSHEINFKVKGPYWSSWWFIALCLLALGALIYIALRWLLLTLRKGDLVEKKLVHLERSALLSQMNPHFIFNSLNSIQSYIANNENDKANRFLAKFSRLIRAMLNHSRSAKVTLQEEIDSLNLYLDMEKMRFKEKFSYSITVDEDLDTNLIELPPMLIQPYLENAIIHGLSKKEGNGRIELFYMLHKNYLIVTVTDNGIGIEQSKKLKEGKTSALHKSVGMTITQKRLELLDDKKDDKKVDIQEVRDRSGKVLGTKVEVKIRVETD